MVRYELRSRRARDKASRIAATEAAKNFGRLVDRVREEGITYIVERNGVPVARVGPVGPPVSTMADLVALMRDAPHVDEEYLRAVEDGIRRFNKPRVPTDPWAR